MCTDSHGQMVTLWHYDNKNTAVGGAGGAPGQRSCMESVDARQWPRALSGLKVPLL